MSVRGKRLFARLSLLFGAITLSVLPGRLVLAIQPGQIQVEVHGAGKVSEIAHPAVRVALKAMEMEPIPKNLHPEFESFRQRLGPFVERLLVDRDHQDGARKIHVVLVDDMTVNASFLKLNDSERLITLNLGTLHFIESDDELAFLLGHELEHGPSELQEVIDQLEDESDFKRLLLQRSVENEVDVKSAVHRLHEKDFNPHAASRFLGRLREKEGDGLSASHPMTGSRKDSVGLALTLLKRERGERLPDDHPSQYSRSFIGPLQDRYLRTDGFVKGQLERVDQAIDSGPNPALEIYRKAVTGLSPPNVSEQTPFRAIVQERVDRASRLTTGLLSQREWVDVQVQILDRTAQDFEHARAEIVPRGFKPGSPGQLERIIEADLWSLPGRVRKDLDVVYLKYEIQDQEKQLGRLRLKKGPGPASERIAIEKKLKVLRESYEAARSAFEEGPEFETWLRGAAQESGKWESARIARITSEMEARIRQVGPRLAEADHRVRQALESSVDILIRGLAQTGDLTLLKERVGRFLSLPREVVLQKSEVAFRSLVQGLRRSLKSGKYKVAKSIADTLLYNTTSSPLRELFTLHHQRNPKAAMADLKSVIKDVISASKYTDELDSVFIPGGMNSRFAREFFDSEMTEYLLDRYRKLIPGELRDEGFDSIGRYLSRIQSFERKKIPTPGYWRSREVIDRTLSLVPVLGRYISKDLALHDGAPPGREELRALIRGYSPEFLGWEMRMGEVDFEGVERDFRKLLIHLRKSDVRPQPLFRFHDLAYFLKKHKTPERVFGLMTEMESYLEFNGILDSLDINETVYLEDLENQATGYFSWLKKRHPSRTDLMVRVLASPATTKQYRAMRREFFLQRLNHHLKKHGALPLRERTRRAFADLWRELENWKLLDESSLTDSSHVSWVANQLPRSPAKRLEFFIGFMESFPSDLENRGHFYSGAWVTDLGVKAWDQVPLDSLVEAQGHLLRGGEKTAEVDEFFEFVWKKTESHPELRARLRDTRLVRGLYYDQNRIRLAQWQLGDLIQRAPPANKKGVRKEIQAAMEMIHAQFEGRSAAKNAVIDFVESRLTTNDLETRYLSQAKIGLENWKESKVLYALDSPHAAVELLRTNHQRWEMIRHLIGRGGNQIPSFIADMVDEGKKEKIFREFKLLTRFFRETDPVSRSYLLQSLLGAQDGVLSDPALKRELERMILGGHVDHPVVKRVFDAYLKALPESEQKVVLSYILGSMADSKRGSRPSLRVILEAMGPFGIKAGQFLRTSGLAGPELRSELDGFFDQAHTPSRDQIFADLKKVFGDNLRNVVNIRELAGSGSINYVVIADVRNPGTKKNERVVIRIRRGGVEGQVANENAIWEVVIRDLEATQGREEQRWARVLSEARRQSYGMLKTGGQELNLEWERKAYSDAARAYRSNGAHPSGFKVSVSGPVEEIQQLVPAELSEQVSVYGYVEHTPLKKISDAKLRAALADQIVEAELNALLERGAFDPDGHPGNWLVDLENKKLVRIDYAQLRHVDSRTQVVLKESLRALVDPAMEEDSVDALARHFDDLFEIEGPRPQNLRVQDLRVMIRDIVQGRGLPSYRESHERLFFLRDRLEERLSARNRQVLLTLKDIPRSAFASLARMRVYSEYMGAKRYSERILRALDLNPGRYRWQVARSWVSRPLRRARQALSPPAIGRAIQKARCRLEDVISRLRGDR